MKSKLLKSFFLAMLMGTLTIIFCLAIADGALHMYSSYNLHLWENVIFGRVFFTVFIIGLPLAFIKNVKWRHSIINIPLYFLLYFPVYYIAGSSKYHLFLENSGGFIALPATFNAIVMTIIFWSIQSSVYLIFNLVMFIYRKTKTQ